MRGAPTSGAVERMSPYPTLVQIKQRMARNRCALKRSLRNQTGTTNLRSTGQAARILCAAFSPATDPKEHMVHSKRGERLR
jgi:hypothetical protein